MGTSVARTQLRAGTEGIHGDYDVMERGNPMYFYADEYTPTMFLWHSEKYDVNEAYDFTGYLTAAADEGDAEKVLGLFSPAAREKWQVSEADAQQLIDTLGQVESFSGGIVREENFATYTNGTGFTGQNYFVAARYLCKTDSGYVLLNLRYFREYDDDSSYIGLWSAEAEERDSGEWTRFRTQLPAREAGVRAER